MPKRLQERLINIPLTGGLNTKAAPKLVPPGQNLKAENVVQEQSGEWRVRDGGTNLEVDDHNGVDFTNGFRLAKLGDRLIQIPKLPNSTSLGDPSYQFHAAPSDIWSGNPNTDFEPCSIRSRQTLVGASSEGNLLDPSIVYNATHDIVLVAWHNNDSLAIDYKLYDGTTGAEINTGSTQSITSSSFPHCVGKSGSYVAIVYSDQGASDIKSLRIDVSSTSFTNATHTFAGTSAATAVALDVMEISTSLVLIAYDDNPVTTVNVTEYDLSAGTSSTFTQALGSNLNTVGWILDNNANSTHYLAYSRNTGGVAFRTYATGGTFGAENVMDASTTAWNITGYTTSGTGFLVIYWTTTSTASTGPGAEIKTNAWLGSAGTPSVHLRGLSLASHVFAVPDGGTTQHFYLASYDTASGITASQNTYFLMPAHGVAAVMGPVCKLSQWKGRGVFTQSNLTRFVPKDSAFLFAVEEEKRLLGANASVSRVVNRVDLDLNPSEHGESVQVDGQLYYPGGCMQYLGGPINAEADFLLYPDKPSGIEDAGGSLTALGAYKYILVFAGVNGNGDVVRSAPTEVFSVTLTGGNQSVVLTMRNLGVGGRAHANLKNVIIEVYRNEAGGTVYYRAATVDNDPTAHTQTLDDSLADATLINNEQLYSTGAGGTVLTAHSAPQATVLALYRDRMFAIDAETPTFLWFTKRKAVGTAFQWNETNRLHIDDGTGDMTALAVMNERLIIFKKNAIYVLAGEGPNDIGQGSYPHPSQLPSDVGTTAPLSVVVTSLGVFFQEPHSQGIYLLGNNLAVSYIGQVIDGTLAEAVTSAVVMHDDRQVRFTTAGGTTYIYDLTHGVWITWTNQAANHAIAVNDQWYFLNTSGIVVQETAGTQDPSATNVTPAFATTNLSLAGIGGFVRLWEAILLGDVIGACSVRVKVFYDDESAASQTITKAVTASTKLRMPIRIQRQKASMIKLEIDVTYGGGESSATGAVRFSALTLRAGVKTGIDKAIGQAARAG